MSKAPSLRPPLLKWKCTSRAKAAKVDGGDRLKPFQNEPMALVNRWSARKSKQVKRVANDCYQSELWPLPACKPYKIVQQLLAGQMRDFADYHQVGAMQRIQPTIQ